MSSKRVLVCDDEPHIVHVVAAKLRNAGIEVFTAPDGQEGLRLAGELIPDLIITDYQMPYLSGLELCVKLKSTPATSRIPVVMLTARGFSLSDAELVNTNVQKVHVKPFSPRELLRTAQEIMRFDSVSPEAALP